MVEHSEIWAKGPTEGNPGESLVSHTLHVVRRIAQLRDRAPFLPELCGDSRLWHRVALAATVHDLGKGDPRFQQMLRQVSPDLRTRSIYDQRHEVMSLAWLDWVLGGDPFEDRFAVAAAVASHHRDHRVIKLKYSLGSDWNPAPNISDFVTPVPVETFPRIAALYREQILPATRELGLLDEKWPSPSPWASSGSDRQIAITSIRRNLGLWDDWMVDVANDPANEICRLRGFLLRGLILLADHSGSARESFRSLPLLAQSAELGVRLSPRNGNPYFPHQDEAATTVGHAILVAPTGSGKTEAAMRWAARQYEGSLGTPPLFYVLPFKASMNAMQDRLVKRITSQTPTSDPRPEFVALQHSSAAQVLYHQLMSEFDAPSVNQAEWMVRRQKNLAKLHVTPIRVLSPYQLLRAAYQLKGHEALWTDAAGGVFIFDEIHAYEPQRLARILEMLRFLVKNFGARVLVMTATMPGVIRDRLAEILDQPRVIRAHEATFDLFRRHRLRLRDAGLLDDPTIQDVVARALKGEAVLCVATTVGRAQKLQSILQSRLPQGTKVRLLHSRFTGEDRAAKEQELRDLIATGGPRSEQVVLVATQVVEVSLDVDFDVLFSDPAPLDALLQRFGRVNRSRRPEPHDVIVCARIEDSQPVYSQHLVEAAMNRLRAMNDQIIDERDVQRWLDEIYAGPLVQALNKALDEVSKSFSQVLNSIMPFDSNDELEKMFYDQFDGVEVIPKSLLERYREALEAERFKSASLTVPISSRQLRMLAGNHAILAAEACDLPRGSPFVVDVPYDSELGLAINPPPGQDNT